SRGTPDHWSDAGWWPTKGTSSHTEYAGTAACATCHKQIVDSQETTPMRNAASLPAESQILKKHPELPFTDEKYEYVLARRPSETLQSVKSKSSAVSAPVAWAFGAGEVSQTYVFERDHKYLESRLSYYTRLSSLGITPGHSADAPDAIEDAIGDAVDNETMRRCF